MRDVYDRPVLNDLAVTDAVDRNPVGLDFPVRPGDSEELSLVHASPQDVAYDEIALRHLHQDLVASRSCDTKDLRGLLHPVTIQADARNRGIVRYETLRDVLVENAPVAGVVVVDRFDVAPDQIPILPRLTSRPSPRSFQWVLGL